MIYASRSRSSAAPRARVIEGRSTLIERSRATASSFCTPTFMRTLLDFRPGRRHGSPSRRLCCGARGSVPDCGIESLRLALGRALETAIEPFDVSLLQLRRDALPLDLAIAQRSRSVAPEDLDLLGDIIALAEPFA